MSEDGCHVSHRSMPHSIATKFIIRLADLSHESAATRHLPMLVRMAVNLLKRHPGTLPLIHSKASNGAESVSLLAVKDLQLHFDSEIRDIAKEINCKLNDHIDNALPSKSIEAKEKV